MPTLPLNIAVRMTPAENRHMQPHIYSRRDQAASDSFGAPLRADRKRWKEPVLVSSGMASGTKLKVAMAWCAPPPSACDPSVIMRQRHFVQAPSRCFVSTYLAWGGSSIAGS